MSGPENFPIFLYRFDLYGSRVTDEAQLAEIN